jgi:hypothetical protein
MRVILSVLYTMLEVTRCFDSDLAPLLISADGDNQSEEKKSDSRAAAALELQKQYENMKTLLRAELIRPLGKINELFSVYLFQLITKFCNQNVIILPVKKLLLMLWKVLLVR